MSKLIKKIIPYLLVLIVLVGFFGPARKAQAQLTGDSCMLSNGTEGVYNQSGNCVPKGSTNTTPVGSQVCVYINQTTGLWVEGPPPPAGVGGCSALNGGYMADPGTAAQLNAGNVPGTGTTSSTTTPANQTEFEKQINAQACGLNPWGEGTVMGCIVQASYIIFYTTPAYLLWAAAYFFDVLIFITLGSKLLAGAAFVSAGWIIVRDLSNIFFILILLYIAIKLILDLGGHDVKKMIIKVIVLALLINFSMFMTEVVIDSSNILALVFYNKLEVNQKDPVTKQSVPITYTPALASVFGVEKDVAGALTAAFDPTKLLTEKFFKAAGTQQVPGYAPVVGKPSASILIGITIIAGALMFFAAYAFFVAGISFVGRLIELWVLIIFSPFAFMSFAVPLLEKTEYIGWDAWHKRLIKVSFMAPIFMFFIYFIFLLLHEGNPFGNVIENNGGAINTILLVVIPAVVILILLLKATEFAKKGSGKLGEFASTAGKMIGGAVVGSTIGSAALVGTRLIGGAGGAILNKTAAGAERMGLNRVGSGLRNVSDFARKSSFDIRGVKIAGQTLASATGIPVGEAGKGTWNETKKKQIENRQKRADELIKRGTTGQRKNVDEAKAKLNEATLPVKVDLENADKVIEKFRKELSDAQKGGDPAGIAAAKSLLAVVKGTKARIRTRAGLDALERGVHDAERELDKKTGEVASKYAKQISGKLSKTINFVFRGGYSMAGADEAARRIRSGAKVVEEKH